MGSLKTNVHGRALSGRELRYCSKGSPLWEALNKGFLEVHGKKFFFREVEEPWEVEEVLKKRREVYQKQGISDSLIDGVDSFDSNSSTSYFVLQDQNFNISRGIKIIDRKVSGVLPSEISYKTSLGENEVCLDQPVNGSRNIDRSVLESFLEKYRDSERFYEVGGHFSEENGNNYPRCMHPGYFLIYGITAIARDRNWDGAIITSNPVHALAYRSLGLPFDIVTENYFDFWNRPATTMIIDKSEFIKVAKKLPYPKPSFLEHSKEVYQKHLRPLQELVGLS